MKIEEKYFVQSIKKSICNEWLLKKHYARRIPSINFSFGLYVKETKICVGVCTYGIPASGTLTEGICGKKNADLVTELNRLTLLDELETNAASYFISRTFRLLPKPMVIVSFADPTMNHIGYVYQATNFIYTGLSMKRTEWQQHGVDTHSKTLTEQYTLEQLRNNPRFYQRTRPRKHRYIKFLGTRKVRKQLLNDLLYPIKKYPKGDASHYKNDAEIAQQILMI